MPIHVIVQYCTHPLPQRVAEYDECVERNLANPHVAMVHNLAQVGTAVPLQFQSHRKYRAKPLGRWMTYRDAFDYANAELSGELVCVSNLDVFLDPQTQWDAAAQILSDGVRVLCLSRIEMRRDGSIFKDPELDRLSFALSQDAWVFRPPINVKNCDFEIGILGCDNAIAHRLRNSGYVR